ncbi:MAG TPA: hypothetical protein VJL90_09500 [Pseudorhodoplanes sp.]|nr:hypothetical protein [Pseudorhodoplanes sp.]
MSDFAKLLGRFFARDFIYFLGGLFIIISAASVFFFKNDLDSFYSAAEAIPTVLWIPVAALSYILGYLANFCAGMLGLNSAGDRLVPWSGVHPVRGKIARLVFFILNRYPMDELVKGIDTKVTIKDAASIKPAHIYALQAMHPGQDYLARTITLHHLSSVFGASLLVCGTLFLSAYVCVTPRYALCSGILLLAAGIILCFDSNYRSFQVAFAISMINKWRIPIAKVHEKQD